MAIATYVDGSPAPMNVVEMDDLPTPFRMVQTLPDKTYLVVAARCELQAEGPEDNALIFAEDGSVVARGCLGDGIEHVQTDEAGTIWVGYFDEGIFGNLGWGERGGPPPLGSPGIVRWSTGFEKLWEFKHEGTYIDDCYALNVASDGVWASSYSDSPIIRIDAGRVRVFSTSDLSGPKGVVAEGSRVGVLGRYDDHSAFVVGDLTGERFLEVSRGHVWMPDDGPFPSATLHCRGATAHLFVGAEWLTVELNDLE